LVTGGVGFVGSHFARLAVEAGRRVVVLDDFSGGGRPRLPDAVRVIEGDIADRALVTGLLRDHRVTAVAHFAGKIQVGESVEKPALYYERNVVRSLALLDVIREHAPLTVLFSSTAAVYGTPEKTPIDEASRLAPISPYGATKLAIEQALEAYGVAYGIRWAALRYFNAAGAHPDGTLRENHEPETHLVPLVIDAALGRRGPLTVFGEDYPTADGTCIRDYVHVLDLARAHLAAIDALDAGRPVGIVNLASGRGFSVREVLDEAARVLGKAVPYSIGPRRVGDPAVLLASCARAAAVLGWRTERSDLTSILADAAASRR
jgi:UDP-glucose-4-epimerase GalE